MNFREGEQVLCQWKGPLQNSRCELVNLSERKGDEHEDAVLAFDVHMQKELFVTSDADGLIKLWDWNKNLVREIKFTEPISCVCFMNENADLMAGHGGKLSRIRAVDYLPYDYHTLPSSSVTSLPY